MPEIHTADFIRGSINIISDAGRGTITLQFARDGDGLNAIGPILKALGRRYGAGALGRLNRWRTGGGSPFVLSSRIKPHPANPDVLRVEIRVKQGERFESALATLLEFFRQQPGYRRTFGSPLDRDSTPSRAQKVPSGDLSDLARDVLRQMFRRPGE